MKDTLLQYAANKITPDPGAPEWYFFLIIISVIISIFGYTWLTLKFPKRIDSSTKEDRHKPHQEQTGAPMPARELSQFQKMIEIQFKNFEQVLETKLESVAETTSLQIRLIDQKVSNIQETETHQLRRLEQLVDEGFTCVHRRIDRHIEAHNEIEEKYNDT